MLSTSRRRSFRALVLCAVSTDCGKSMMTGPSAPTRMLKSERSPCTTPAASIRTTSRISFPYIACAASGSNIKSASRGAGLPSASMMSSMISTPSMKCRGVGTRTPAAWRRWIMSTSVRLPRGLVLRAAVLRPLSDRALVAGVPDLAPFGVLGALLERAVLSVLVDLRDTVLSARHDDVDLGFLAAHQRPDDIVEDAVVVERGERIGDAHAGVLPPDRGHHAADMDGARFAKSRREPIEGLAPLMRRGLHPVDFVVERHRRSVQLLLLSRRCGVGTPRTPHRGPSWPRSWRSCTRRPAGIRGTDPLRSGLPSQDGRGASTRCSRGAPESPRARATERRGRSRRAILRVR